MTPDPAVTNEDGKLTIDFIANATQKRFIESQSKADLFACRAGEGKSTGLVWACYWHTLNNPGARSLIMRDTWVNCEATTQEEFFFWFRPFGDYNKGKRTFTWHAQDMRGTVRFLGIDDEKDVHKLQAMNLGACYMDEPAPAESGMGGIPESVFDFILGTRLRQTGMNWSAMKLAENNPDESHWTYRRFVEDKNPKFKLWQTAEPENERNLPPNYYAEMEETYRASGREDLIRRYSKGTFGFQQTGKPVTPEWNDDLHLADHLSPAEGYPLRLLWDFGLNPTCTITQMDSLGHWNFLECHTMDGRGVYELISEVVKPRLRERFEGLGWEHTGDPMGKMREQSSSGNSAIKVIRNELGGSWHPGPVRIHERVDPLRAVLRKTTGKDGKGIIRVDRELAKPIWHALRGGWHRNVLSGGRVTSDPVKDMHSHPGDTASYGAARYYPLGSLKPRKVTRTASPRPSHYFGGKTGPLGFERPGLKLPKEAQTIGGPHG